MKSKFKKVVIVGPGLIGGSIGLALRSYKLAELIVGVARHRSTLSQAKKRKVIDFGCRDIKRAVIDADLVILAIPVGSIKKIITQMKDSLKAGCIVFDVGSSKKEIVEVVEKFLHESVSVVGTHPMAGSEKTGVINSKKSLFENSISFITKTRKTNPKALKQVLTLWKKLGARTIILSPAVHDRIVAQVSHLPHFIVVALVASVSDKFLKFAATGFKDTTRIASGAADMWRDISFSNKEAILRSITEFEKKLNSLKKLLKEDRPALFTRQLMAAKAKRDAIR